jgi:hypothetical protein
VEAAEQERRHGRGHRHGRPLTTFRRLYTGFSRQRRVRHRLCYSQRRGGKPRCSPAGDAQATHGSICLAYAAASRGKKWLACLLTEVGYSTASAACFYSRAAACQPWRSAVVYGLLGREWYLAHAFVPRINASTVGGKRVEASCFPLVQVKWFCHVSCGLD